MLIQFPEVQAEVKMGSRWKMIEMETETVSPNQQQSHLKKLKMMIPIPRVLPALFFSQLYLLLDSKLARVSALEVLMKSETAK